MSAIFKLLQNALKNKPLKVQIFGSNLPHHAFVGFDDSV